MLRLRAKHHTDRQQQPIGPTDEMAKRGRNGTSHPKPAELHPFFEDVKCKIFFNEKCSDIDLTVVCSKILDNCFPIAAIGVCLGLEESVVQEVTKGYEHSPHKDVLHQLLVKWKVSKESVEKDTWASLVQSLASLANSEPLLEDIRKYLCQRDNPRPEAVGKHSHDMSAIQEETSTPDSLAFYGVSPPLSGSPASSFLQGFTSAMAQETSAQSRMTHALVTGSSVMPVSTARSDARVNLSVKKKLREEEEKFSALLAFSSERLQDMGVSPDKLKVYLTQLSVSQKENIPQFSEHMAGIISVDSHSKIFTFLSRIGAWGFLNFYLLKCVANRYGDDEMKSKVEKYGNEVDTFKSETKVKDYLRASSNQSPYGSLPERKPLIAKLEEEWEECTLADIAEQEGYLAGEFLLEQYIFHFSNAAPGSVTLMWLIPAPAIPLIRRAITENRVKLKGTICELIVGDERFIFKVCAPYTPKLPQVGVSEQQTGRCTITSDDPLEQLMNADYATTYEESVRNPEKFWGDLAEKCLLWKKPFDKVMDCDMDKGEIRWFTGGKLNVSENCLDRHVKRDPERIALIWEKNEPQQHESLTYRELLDMTCRIANVLKQNGIKKGDTVVIYMPAFPVTVASMLACARIGAVHCVVFAAYNASVLRERICDAKAKAVITANQAVIGRKVLNLKENVDEAVPGTGVKVVFVATRVPRVTVAQKPRDVPLEQAMAEQPTECPPEPMDSEDKLFIIYTSGTSDNPKGIVHTQAGYLLHVAVTHRCVFNYKPGEVFSYVSDLGWLPGHTYVVYGSLCNGGTTVLFEGTACYPDYNRYWEMIERLKINHFSTSPSAIRQLMKHGDQHVLKHDLSSLKTIGTAGEPMNISAWQWYHDVVGKGRCIVLDSWWQTETGAITITPNPAPRGIKPKPGFSMKPFYGVLPVLVDEEEKEITGNDVKGRLCLKKPLPGMGRDINGDSQKYKDLYFGKHKGLYFTYDMAHRDDDGDYQIIGRVDDVTAIKGVWVDVPRIENTMNMSDPRILESFLVGYKQEGSNEFEHATFVKLMEEVDEEEINLTAVITVMKQALTSSNLKVPKSKFYIVNKQPKTHSGKIIRKFLKQLAPGTVTLVETFDGVIKMEDCLNNMGIARSFYCLTC